jgi:hypothetical protein
LPNAGGRIVGDWISVVLLVLKDDRATREVVITRERPDEDEKFNAIRCPQCDWRPVASSRWQCTGAGTPEAPFTGCGATWNTFVTGGVCPGCSHQWRWTSCHRCREWSPHDEWYDLES